MNRLATHEAAVLGVDGREAGRCDRRRGGRARMGCKWFEETGVGDRREARRPLPC